MILGLLEEMNEEEFKKFKLQLADYPLRVGISPIPREDLDAADRTTTSNLMINQYPDPYVLEIMENLLQEMTKKDDLLKISQHTSETQSKSGAESFDCRTQRQSTMIPQDLWRRSEETSCSGNLAHQILGSDGGRPGEPSGAEDVDLLYPRHITGMEGSEGRRFREFSEAENEHHFCSCLWAFLSFLMRVVRALARWIGCRRDSGRLSGAEEVTASRNIECGLHLEILPGTEEVSESRNNGFMDLRTAFDKVQRLLLWDILRSKSLPAKYLRVLKLIHSDQEDPNKKYKDYIKDKFATVKEKTSLLTEQVALKKVYKELLFGMYNFTEQWAEDHRILQLKSPVKSINAIPHIFDPERWGERELDVPTTVVLAGEAGIGKTMITQKLMLDWASGDLFQDRFQYVFYIPCRELDEHWWQKPVEDLIINSCGGKTLLSRTDVEADPRKLLFIIDGFDELKMPEDLPQYISEKQCTMDKTLISLINTSYPLESYIIITTRTTASETLMQFLNIERRTTYFAEIIGLTNEARLNYFTSFCDNEKHCADTIDILKQNGTVYNMCFVPKVSWIVCSVIKQQMEKEEDVVNSLRTMTSVYLLFLSNRLTEQDTNAIHPTITLQLKTLCALAKEGIYQNKTLFDKDELIKQGVDVQGLQSQFLLNIFQKDHENDNIYSFLHLTVQEFFAALFYLLGKNEVDSSHRQNPQPAVIDLLAEYGKSYGSNWYQSKMRMTVRFLFGLLNEERLDQLQKIFQFKISSDLKTVLQKWVHEQIKQCGGVICNDQVDLIHNLYEMQDEEFVRRATTNLKVISLSEESEYEERTVVDIRALAFCLKNSSGVEEIHLAKMRIKQEDLRALIPGLLKCSYLTLEHCALTSSCCADLASVPRTNPSLKELDVSWNKLQDSGMRELCKGLKHPGCNIRALRINGCSFTGSCCADLSYILRTKTSLTELDLRSNRLKDSGVRDLCRGLKHPGCNLKTLSKNKCDLSSRGFSNLSSALRTRTSKKILEPSRNNLHTCSGHKYRKVSALKLRMMHCSLTASDCAELSSVFRTNTPLTEQEDSVVRELCEGLKNPNCCLQTIKLVENDLSNISTEALCLTLNINHSMNYLYQLEDYVQRRSAVPFYSLKGFFIRLKEPDLVYLSLDQAQMYSKLNVKDLLAKAIVNSSKEEKNKKSDWKIKVEEEDIEQPTGPEDFIRTHRRALQNQIGNPQTIIEILKARNILRDYEADAVLAEENNYVKNYRLIRMVVNKGPEAQREFVVALKETGLTLFQDSSASPLEILTTYICL